MRAHGGRVETEGLHFIYRAILPQANRFVNSFSKKFSLFYVCFSQAFFSDHSRRFARADILPAVRRCAQCACSERRTEQVFGTTCMSIGKIAKMLLKKHNDFLTRSAFHEISRQKSSTLLIYKSRLMRYNNLARRKWMFRRKSTAQVGLCGISISWYQACKDAKRCTCSVHTGRFSWTDTEAGSVYADSVFLRIFLKILYYNCK